MEEEEEEEIRKIRKIGRSKWINREITGGKEVRKEGTERREEGSHKD